MINWNDVMINRERNKDLLREAEKERLIQQVAAADNELNVWQKMKDLFADKSKYEATEDVGCISSWDATG